jgi:hypothetical protein
LRAELQEIARPAAKALMVINGLTAFMDGAASRDRLAPGSGVAFRGAPASGRCSGRSIRG